MANFLRFAAGHVINMDHVVTYTPAGCDMVIGNVPVLAKHGSLQMINGGQLFMTLPEDTVLIEDYFDRVVATE